MPKEVIHLDHVSKKFQKDLVLKDILAQLWKTRRGTGAP